MSKRKRVDEAVSRACLLVNTLGYQDQKMLELWRAEKFCDVSFSVEERKFSAHRIVLASSSDVLGAQFSQTMSDSQTATVHLHEMSADAFGAALEFVYAGCLELTDADALLPLLQVGHRLQMADLIEAAVECIVSRLESLDASAVWQLGDMLQIRELQDAALSPHGAERHPEYLSAEEAKALKFTPVQMEAAGYHWREIKEVGFSLQELADAELLVPCVCSAEQAKTLGYTAEQMKAAGYQPRECRDAGYSLRDLAAAKHLAPDLCSAVKAKELGYLPWDCKVAGFSFEEATRAGFVTWGRERRDFWFSTGRYAGSGLSERGRRYAW